MRRPPLARVRQIAPPVRCAQQLPTILTHMLTVLLLLGWTQWSRACVANSLRKVKMVCSFDIFYSIQCRYDRSFSLSPQLVMRCWRVSPLFCHVPAGPLLDARFRPRLVLTLHLPSASNRCFTWRMAMRPCRPTRARCSPIRPCSSCAPARANFFGAQVLRH